MQETNTSLLHNKKLENPDYWDMLSLDHGPDEMVLQLGNYLAIGSSIIDLGPGRGRNSIPLAKMGYSVTAHDIGVKAINDLQLSAQSQGMYITTRIGDISEYRDTVIYDACVMIRVLHFLSHRDAVSLIHHLQEYTPIGGYHVLIFFTRAPMGSEKYFPSREGLLGEYVGWEILTEYSEIIQTAEGREMPRIAMILRKNKK